MKLSLHWRAFGALVVLLAALILAINLALDFSLPPYLRKRVENDLTREAMLARAALSGLDAGELNAAAHHLQNQTGLRFTVIATNGVVIAESDKAPEQLAAIENHLFRPEVQDALKLGLGAARRHSDTVDVDLAYVAVPGPFGVVRVAEPLHQIAATTHRVQRTVAIASLIAGLAAIPVTYWLTRRVTLPICLMREAAGRFARGDFSRRAPAGLVGELGDLAAALDNMADQLAARLRELGEQKAGLDAVLASMTDGVLVVEASGRIRLINRALRQMFQLTDEALGRTPLEALRHIGLEELLREPGTRELSFAAPAECTFLVSAAALCNHGGMVVVFHDITRLKHLENLRKEFVANVSHELRTPLAVIRGYIETLLEEPAPDAPTARRFQETIRKHALRLEALIDDLLSISALESQQAHIEPSLLRLADVAAAAAEDLERQAIEKSMTVAIDVPADLPPARADRQRLHQVLLNLLANAIQYTKPGGHVSVSARAVGGEIECCVADDGPGIAPEHLPRIFERFYRVEKARSRDAGGTGLGLSIVKHIILAHGGRVWAESTPAQGSRFFFTLPIAG